MKDKLIGFIKNKFNIALIAIQLCALVFYALSGLWEFFPILFFVSEGAFFIVWGVKLLVEMRKVTTSQEILSQIPMSEQERLELAKRNVRIEKNNKFIAIILIILGIVLVFSILSVLF